jgi:hypothetical protein
MKIVADCHNSTFDVPWRNWPGMVRQLNSVDAVLIHNSVLLSEVLALGVLRSKIHVIDDPPATIQRFDGKGAEVAYPRPWVLFMTAFGPDEPIREVLAAATLVPDVTIVVAGDRRRARGRHQLDPHSANVVFAGYLGSAALDTTIMEADAVLALTKNYDEQLSAAAEAVGGGKAMILADTPLLRDMYPCGAIYVKADEPSSIALGCRDAIAQRQKLEKESMKLRSERLLKWSHNASAFADALGVRKQTSFSDDKS